MRRPLFELRRVIGDGGLSLALNVAVIGFVIHVSPVTDIRRPDQSAISVDLISEPPGGGQSETKPTGGPSDGAEPQPVSKQEPAAKPLVAPEPVKEEQPKDALADKIPLPPATLTPPQDPPSAEPKPPRSAPAPAPAMGASATPTLPSSSTPAPVPQAVSSASPATSPSAQPPLPPPLDGHDDVAHPRLIEAPPDPRAAQQQSNDKTVQANALPEASEAAKTVTPSAAVPTILTTPDGDDTVPAAPARTDPVATTVQPSVETSREADNTAKLAAALPFSQSFLPQTTRAATAGSGTAAAEAYRGAVYGAIRQDNDLVASARARHLHGQAVVAFEIDDTGGLISASVAVSSGNPEVDQTVLEMIKRSAPFPAPPPGGPHRFAPAIGLGLDGY